MHILCDNTRHVKLCQLAWNWKTILGKLEYCSWRCYYSHLANELKMWVNCTKNNSGEEQKEWAEGKSESLWWYMFFVIKVSTKAILRERRVRCIKLQWKKLQRMFWEQVHVVQVLLVSQITGKLLPWRVCLVALHCATATKVNKSTAKYIAPE